LRRFRSPIGARSVGNGRLETSHRKKETSVRELLRGILSANSRSGWAIPAVFLDRVGSDFTARCAAPKSPTAAVSRGIHGLGLIRTVKVISHALTTIIGILVAGAVSGATGVALPLIAGPVFLMTFAPVEAVALTALCSITGQL